MLCSDDAATEFMGDEERMKETNMIMHKHVHMYTHTHTHQDKVDTTDAHFLQPYNPFKREGCQRTTLDPGELDLKTP